MLDQLASISRLHAFVEDPTNAEASAWLAERIAIYLEHAYTIWNHPLQEPIDDANRYPCAFPAADARAWLGSQ